MVSTSRFASGSWLARRPPLPPQDNRVTELLGHTKGWGGELPACLTEVHSLPLLSENPERMSG